MKRSIRWLLALSMLGCYSCRSGVNSESRKAAQQYIDNHFIKCGDSYYSWNQLDYNITQWKGFSWDVVPEFSDMSEAQKLNDEAQGVEARVFINVDCSASRQYLAWKFSPYWDDWTTGCPARVAYLIKQKGIWLHGGLTPLDKEKNTKSCADVAKLK
jgi:hypothetical protein